jgi:uncharacterized protein YndB with AHSA1/START domain
MDARGDKEITMNNAGKFEVSTPDREILLTRTFDAPRAAVFEAWTKAEHVKHWWDPSGVPLSVCEIDLRPNGAFRWVNSAHGGEHTFTGTYREIMPPERLVFTVKMFPSRPDPLTTVLFSEEGNNKTMLIMKIECNSVEDRDALLQMRMDVGTGKTLKNLADYLNGITDRKEK